MPQSYTHPVRGSSWLPRHEINTAAFAAVSLCRLYLINSPVVRSENLRFKEEGVRDVLKDVFLPWYNAYRFLVQNVQRLQKVGVSPTPWKVLRCLHGQLVCPIRSSAPLVQSAPFIFRTCHVSNDSAPNIFFCC